jgi:hypothetical protein
MYISLSSKQTLITGKDRAIAQAISSQLLTVEPTVIPGVSPCGIRGQVTLGQNFLKEIWLLRANYNYLQLLFKNYALKKYRGMEV